MFSDQYGSLTTTFIRNEVDYLVQRHDFFYLAEKASREIPPPGRLIQLSYEDGWLHSRIRWVLWQKDLACNFRNRKYASRLASIVERVAPDVIHCQFGYEALKLMQNLPAGLNIPIIIHFHGYDASEMLHKSSYIRELKLMLEKHQRTSIVTVSDFMMNSLKEKGIASEQSFVHRCGIDTDKFSFEAKAAREVKVFLQVSSLSKKKGHDYTIVAISKLIEQHPHLREKLRFVFTGNGDRLSELQNKAAEYGIADILSFVGNKSVEEVSTLLKEADYFIHPSITASNGDQEGIPTAIMEAMAVGLPIISTWHAGIPELVEHGVNGLLSHEKDVDGLASNLYEILGWQRLEINRQKVQDEYQLEDHNRRLEAIYYSLI